MISFLNTNAPMDVYTQFLNKDDASRLYEPEKYKGATHRVGKNTKYIKNIINTNKDDIATVFNTSFIIKEIRVCFNLLTSDE